MPTPPPDEPEQDRSRIHPDDPVLKILAIHLRKNAELAAKQDMERLIAEAKRQAGEPPKRDL